MSLAGPLVSLHKLLASRGFTAPERLETLSESIPINGLSKRELGPEFFKNQSAFYFSQRFQYAPKI